MIIERRQDGSRKVGQDGLRKVGQDGIWFAKEDRVGNIFTKEEGCLNFYRSEIKTIKTSSNLGSKEQKKKIHQ